MRTISVHDLGGCCEDALEHVRRREVVLVTRYGRPVAELCPLMRRPLQTATLLARWSGLPRVDPAGLRRDVDSVVNGSLWCLTVVGDEFVSLARGYNEAISPTPVADDEVRAQMKAWLDNWKVAGPLLEAERWERVRALTDEEAWRQANELLQTSFPSRGGDEGEGLRLQQAVFTLARRV